MTTSTKRPDGGEQWLWRVFGGGWPRWHEECSNRWGDFSIISRDDAVRLAAEDDQGVYEFVPYRPATPTNESPAPQVVEALKFYADPARYNGSNQRNDSDDKWSDGAAYLKDVTRDGGNIARAALTAPQADETVAAVTYTNWRSETSLRRIIPKSVRYGSTEWHPEPQWLLLAWDDDKKADREFALKDFGPAPQPPVEGLREDVKRWKLVDGKVTTGESVIFDGTFIVAKVTRREDAELILAALASPSLTAGEPDAWQWRSHIGDRQWTGWRELGEQWTIAKFREAYAFNLANGTFEVRPLYAAPATLIEQSGAEKT